MYYVIAQYVQKLDRIHISSFLQIKGDSWVSARTEAIEMMNGLSAAANGLTAAASDGQAAEFRGRSGTFTRNKPAAQPVA